MAFLSALRTTNKSVYLHCIGVKRVVTILKRCTGGAGLKFLSTVAKMHSLIPDIGKKVFQQAKAGSRGGFLNLLLHQQL